MKVIFLDHDGVLCLSDQWGSRIKKTKDWISQNKDSNDIEESDKSTPPIHVRMDNFDLKAVKILNNILEKTKAEIVISSDWKLHASLGEIQDLYRQYGISKVPIAFTPNLSDFDPNSYSLFQWRGWIEYIRILEINKWLEENPVESWVAIDDLDMSNQKHNGFGLDNFILTSRPNTEGIKQSGIESKMIKILNNETNS